MLFAFVPSRILNILYSSSPFTFLGSYLKILVVMYCLLIHTYSLLLLLSLLFAPYRKALIALYCLFVYISLSSSFFTPFCPHYKILVAVCSLLAHTSFLLLFLSIPFALSTLNTISQLYLGLSWLHLICELGEDLNDLKDGRVYQPRVW